MKAILLASKDAKLAEPLSNVRLASRKAFDEDWLQSLLFHNPQLVPLDAIDPGAGALVPIVRELPLPRDNRTVYLDLFGITTTGRPVLIECKLWRNPEARREVVAQLLEYASLLQRWTYADLTARIAAQTKRKGRNPLYEIVAQHGCSLDEARFVDTVSARLVRGDFELIIAGDGIRSDLHVLADYLRNRSSSLSRLSMVEFQVWESSAGQVVVLPVVPVRTEVVTQRVLVTATGATIQYEPEMAASGDDELEDEIRPGAAERRAANRRFWDGIIDRIRFDHPDQPAPRHGGDNWVRIDLPSPARMTLWRSGDSGAGISVELRGEAAREVFVWLQSQQPVLEAEVGEPLSFRESKRRPGSFNVSAWKEFPAAVDLDAAEAAWLLECGNRFVTAFRPRLATQLSKP